MCNFNLRNSHYDMLKLNMVCVDMCACSDMPFMARHPCWPQNSLFYPRMNIILRINSQDFSEILNEARAQQVSKSDSKYFEKTLTGLKIAYFTRLAQNLL